MDETGKNNAPHAAIETPPPHKPAEWRQKTKNELAFEKHGTKYKKFCYWHNCGLRGGEACRLSPKECKEKNDKEHNRMPDALFNELEKPGAKSRSRSRPRSQTPGPSGKGKGEKGKDGKGKGKKGKGESVPTINLGLRQPAALQLSFSRGQSRQRT